jgi:hypothetical protein
MADPQKIQHLVSQAVSARLAEVEKSLVEEITSSLATVVEAAEERANVAEEHVQEAEERAAAAEKRATDAEKAAAEAAAKPSAPTYPPGGAPTDLLGAATASIADASSQADILRATLDGIAQFSARTALYVVKGGQPTGWQSRGFSDDGAIKGSTLDAGKGLVSRAMGDKEPVSAAAAEFDKGFVSTHGNPVDGNATVLPLVVREKVSALIYVDAGTEAPGNADLSAVRVLVRTAAMWLEILALRKVAGGAAAEAEPAPVASAAAEAPAPMAHAAAAAAAPAPAPSAPAPAAGAPDVSGLSSADQEVHKKAKKFAKLLVDEIKLYNQKKVEEGKKNNDIYKRLKEDIDKSRQTYEKRWGSSVAGEANYFHAELVRILADGDESVMGAM